jgi:hypothetical protein
MNSTFEVSRKQLRAALAEILDENAHVAAAVISHLRSKNLATHVKGTFLYSLEKAALPQIKEALNECCTSKTSFLSTEEVEIAYNVLVKLSEMTT